MEPRFTDILLLLPGAFTAAGGLILWNRLAGLLPHQWANDTKNLALCLAKHLDPDRFRRDFLFRNPISADFYLPLPMKVIAWRVKASGDIPSAFAHLHAAFCVCFAGAWVFFAHGASGCVLAALLGILAAIPVCSPYTSDMVCGMLPGCMTPRFWANAFNLAVMGLLLMVPENPPLLPAAALVSGFIYNIHPVSGIGTSLFVHTTLFLALFRGDATWPCAALALAGNLIPAVPFLLSYLKGTGDFRRPPAGSEDHNRQVIERFSMLWPSVYSLLGKRMTSRRDAGFVAVYLLFSLWLFIRATATGDPVWPFAMAALNLLPLLLYSGRHEPFGYVVILCAAIGIFPLPAAYYPALTLLLIVVAVIYRYRRYTLQTALAGMSCLVPLLWMAAGGVVPPAPARPEALAFVWTMPVIVGAYLGGCLVFHRAFPLLLKREIVLIDWGRILKFMYYPAYYFAVIGLARLAGDLTALSGPASLWAGFSLLFLPFCFWRYKIGYLAVNEDEGDLEVFAWIRDNTPADALFHIVSDLPPLHEPGQPETSSFAFRFRILTLRSITGAWKDAGIIFMYFPQMLNAWKRMMDGLREAVSRRDLAFCLHQARELGADYLLVARQAAGGGAPAMAPVKEFERYQLFLTHQSGPEDAHARQ